MKKFKAYCRIGGKYRETMVGYEIVAENLETARSAAKELCHKAGGQLYDVVEVGDVSAEELEKKLYG